MPLKTLTLALFLTTFSSLSVSYAGDTNPTLTETASPEAVPQTAPDISGIYRLKSSERVHLKGGEDPLKDNKIFKGKWIVEKLDAKTFLIFKAETVRNSGTLNYVSIYEFIDGRFFEKLYHMESTIVNNVKIEFANDTLSTVMTENNTLQETNQWQRIHPSEAKPDKYLERALIKAQQRFDEFGWEKYKRLRANATQ